MKNRTSEDLLKELSDRLKKWEETDVEERLSEKDLDRYKVWQGALPQETDAEFRTGSGDATVKRVYTPLDTSAIDYMTEIGLPGQFPFTRGRDPAGYRAWEWPLHFYLGYGTPSDTNARVHKLYDWGARGIDLAFDLPTQLGYGCNHPLSFGEVGKVGVAIDTEHDLAQVFSGLPLENIYMGTVGNSIGPWTLALFYVLGERQGLHPNKQHVWLQNDPFKEYNGRGTCIFPLRQALDLATDAVVFNCDNLPSSWEPLYVTSSMLRWGGCSASQEIAFGLANLVAYLETAALKGSKVEEVMPRLNLHMTADNDLIEEVAKFRATRRLWANLAKERFKTTDPRALGLRITAVTAGYRLTAQEPLNNIVRLTVQMLAAIFGGVEHIIALAYDEALALPTMDSTYLSSLIKILLHHEAYLKNTVDPLGGSYFIEALTKEIEEKAREWYQKVENLGGAIAATEKGYYVEESLKGMYKQQREINRGERVVIGVNKYKREEAHIELFQVDPNAEKLHVKSVAEVKAKRNNAKAEKALSEIRRVAEKKMAGKNENIVPATIQAVRDDVTVGEIFGCLREIFGVHKPNIVF